MSEMPTLPQETARSGCAVTAALHLLRRLGWQFLGTAQALQLRGGTREVLLKPRLIEALQTRRFDYKGESYPLSPSGIDQVVREVQALSLAEGLPAANERLYRKLTQGITVTEFMPDGAKHQPTIALIDWQDPAANRWEVTQALAVRSAQGTHQRVSGIVGYVNGLPLVVIEVTRAEGSHAGKKGVEEAIGQHLRNQRSDEIPQLFAYAQLLLAVSQTEARYGTLGTPLKFWACWSEQAFPEGPMGSRPMLPTEQDRLLAGLLTPVRLLEFLRFFVLFDRTRGKVVARCHQFFGVRALLARINERKSDGSREGGVLWHASGSGKRLTLVFFTKALVLHEKTRACRVLVVTDRLDLEDQLARNCMSSSTFGGATTMRKKGDKGDKGEKAKVVSGRELARRIGQGSERIVVALTAKFATACRLPECGNPSADLIVLVDEGHRSQGGKAHALLRKALPRAACVTFTGTPLLKDEKTANTLGPMVHAYTVEAAVQDGTVAPLLYEERVPEPTLDEAAVKRWFDQATAGLPAPQSAYLKRKFADKRAVSGPADRIELIAWDIAQHFHARIKPLGRGLKGQVATASKLDAIRYQRYLQDTGLVSSAVVISAPHHREGLTGIDEATVPEVQTWWKKNVGRQPQAYEEKVLAGFSSDGEPDLLIVVDRLLTGFDEPRNTVLYIDKPLSGHRLMQAVARVNRLHEAKRHGVLVDYRGLLEELDTAVLASQHPAVRTQGGDELADIDGLDQTFNAQYKRMRGSHQPLTGTQLREPDGMYLVQKAAAQDPEAFVGHAHARVWFGICRQVMGDEAMSVVHAAQWVAQALAIDSVVHQAVAEHFLHPQDVEAAIRQALLPRLFDLMGLAKAREAIEKVLQVTRLALRGDAS